MEVVAYAFEQPMHRFSMQAAGSKPLNGYSFELKGATLVKKMRVPTQLTHTSRINLASKQRARLRLSLVVRMSTELLKIF